MSVKTGMEIATPVMLGVSAHTPFVLPADPGLHVLEPAGRMMRRTRV